MKRPLWEVWISAGIEAEEAIADLLERVLRLPASIYTDEETLVSRISVYASRRSFWNESNQKALNRGLERIRAKGLLDRPARFRMRELPYRDWSESWKRHFKPVTIGDRLLLKPAWSRRRPRPGQVEVILDPGLSFGTGQHATTRFCLSQIVERRRSATPQSFLDIGTGSGILAIAAAKLGYRPIRALDLDPECIRAAQANALVNGVRGQVGIERRDLARLPTRPARKFDLVCANLLAELLVSERNRIVGSVAKGGVLVVAGVLASQFPEVERAYRGSGLRLVASREEGEWKSGVFAFA